MRGRVNHEQKSQQEKEQSPMWEALESAEFGYQELQRGETRPGIVVEKTPDRIVVDIGAKTEGVVHANDLEKLGPEAVARINVGDEVMVYVVRTDNNSGEIIVSMSQARSQQDWTRATELLDSGEIVEAKVVGQNKGGLIAQFGQLQAFVPRSHIVYASGQGENLGAMVGQNIPIKVIEVDRRQRRLIASERLAWKEWRKGQKERILDELKEGAVVTGKVTSITDFGAFVDLGGADGLIHVSELSWDRNAQPKDLLRVGQDVEVYVLNVDRERNRIGLSMKRLRQDPWSDIEARCQPGQLVQGTITNLAKFGAFARIDEGVEGLIHISELADRPVANPGDVVRVGEQYTLKVLGVDTQRKRVSLSLKQAPQPDGMVLAEAEEPTAAIEVTAPEVEGLTPDEVESLAASEVTAPQVESFSFDEAESLADSEPVVEAEATDEPAASSEE